MTHADKRTLSLAAVRSAVAVISGFVPVMVCVPAAIAADFLLDLLVI